MNETTEQHLRRGFDRLKGAVASIPSPPCELLHPAHNAEIATVGDVWVVGEPSARDLENDEPFWVVLVEQAPADHRGRPVWRAAPVFNEIELATNEDAVLPRRIMGARVGIAFGCEAPISTASFRRFVGHLTDEWRGKILCFRQRLDDSSIPMPEGLQTGIPVVHPQDPAFNFHENLAARLEPLMRPILTDALSSVTVEEPATTPWLQAEWQRVVTAAKQTGKQAEEIIGGMTEWVRRFTACLGLAPPSLAGFRADDGRRVGDVQVAEFRVEDSGALFHIVREIPSKAELMLQVLEDSTSSLEGAEIINVDGDLLATVRNGLSSNAFEVTDGWLLIRLASGSLAPLTRVEG